MASNLNLPIRILEPFDAGTVPIFILIAGVLFVIAVGLAYFWKRGAWSDSYVLLALAILLRLCLLPVEPVLSRDVYRYLLDGRLPGLGLNPFLVTPEAALRAYPDEYGDRVEHRQLLSVYPPLAQALFRLSTLGGERAPPRLIAMKAILLFFDLALLLFFYFIARRRDVRWPLYAFHPVSVLEVAWNAHLDVSAVFFLVIGVYAASRNAWLRAGFWLVIGGFVKLLPLVAVPFALRPTLRAAAGVGLGLGVGLAATAFYFEPGFFDGFTSFSKFWTFNSPFYGGLRRFLGHQAGPGWRLVSVGLFGGIAALRFFRRGRAALPETLTGLYLALFCLAPVVHPWYMITLVGLLTLSEGGWHRPALLLTGTVFLSYEVYADFLAQQVWVEKIEILSLVWGPVLALWLWELRPGRAPAAPVVAPPAA